MGDFDWERSAASDPAREEFPVQRRPPPSRPSSHPYGGKCVTCVCVYMVTSGVTVWVSIVSGVWSDSE